MDHRIGIFLGYNSINLYNESSYFDLFKLYIHERGQFWPKSGLNVYSKTIKKNQDKVLKFQTVREHQVIIIQKEFLKFLIFL